MHKQGHSVLILCLVLASICFVELLCLQTHFEVCASPALLTWTTRPSMSQQCWPLTRAVHSSCIRQQLCYQLSRHFCSLWPKQAFTAADWCYGRKDLFLIWCFWEQKAGTWILVSLEETSNNTGKMRSSHTPSIIQTTLKTRFSADII